MASVRQTVVVEKRAIDKLTIKGFKTLQDVELELGKLNVLIGPNGAGKSNFVSYFQLLRELLDKRLQIWVAKRGGADRILTFGSNYTPKLSSQILYGECRFEFALEHSDDDRFVFGNESFSFKAKQVSFADHSGSAHVESSVSFQVPTYASTGLPVIDYAASIRKFLVYHFHDTSNTAPLKLTNQMHDNLYLRKDAGNLAAYLYMLKHGHEEIHYEIVETVRLAIPFFDGFVLEPEALNANGILLKWRHKGFDYEFLPSQLSDGSLRFICLVTALMQPDPPSTIIIDEPELGLHPYAITLLGSLLESASERMQVIVATQSPQLLDEFSVDDLIVVELEDGVSQFKRLNESDFNVWLENYSVGELWDKNVLGGGLP